MHDDAGDSGSGGLSAWLDDPALTDGQKRRIGVFQSVEAAVCARIEEVTGKGEVAVADVAVLVISPEAHELFFDQEVEKGTSVVMGHRDRLYAFLHDALPPAPESGVDPYADLLAGAPPRCVRVLVIDDESLTVMSYGTFVTVEMDPKNRAVA